MKSVTVHFDETEYPRVEKLARQIGIEIDMWLKVHVMNDVELSMPLEEAEKLPDIDLWKPAPDPLDKARQVQPVALQKSLLQPRPRLALRGTSSAR